MHFIERWLHISPIVETGRRTFDDDYSDSRHRNTDGSSNAQLFSQ